MSAAIVASSAASRAPASRVRLTLAGDVMLGRGVDQLNRLHADPVIYESYCRSALDYVALARRRHGEPPAGHPAGAPDDPARVWGTLLPDLLPDPARDRDGPARVLCVNLETALTARGVPARYKGIQYRAHPSSAVAALRAARVDLCALANNHVLDWGVEGLVDTLDALDRGGVARAGAGRDAREAWRPAVLPVQGADGKGADQQGADQQGAVPRVVVVSVAHASSGTPPEWEATDRRPGVATVRFDEPSVRRIREAFARADRETAQMAQMAQMASSAPSAPSAPPPVPPTVRVVSIHWGGNWGFDPDPGQSSFARALVNRAGADVVWGHSSHHVKAFEVVSPGPWMPCRSPVLYGCGDLVNDYEGIEHLSAAAFRDGAGLLYHLEFESRPDRGGDRATLVSAEATPTTTKFLAVNRAEDGGEDARWLASTLSREGSRLGFGTSATADAHGRGRLRLEWPRGA